MPNGEKKVLFIMNRMNRSRARYVRPAILGIFWIKGSPPRWGKKRDGGVGVGGVVGEGILFSRR